MASHLSRVFFRTTHALPHKEVALHFTSYNRPSPSGFLSRENRNLRTIIVIADIDRGLCSPAQQIAPLYPPHLTFRHWSGITPYTSSYEFAGSCVFGKQSPGNNYLRPFK